MMLGRRRHRASAGRQNLFLVSQGFDNGNWTKLNATITPNTIAAPDGQATADAMIEAVTATVTHVISQSVAKVAAQIPVTFSIYAKDKGRTLELSIQGAGGTNGLTWRVDPATGTTVQAAAPYGAGWTVTGAIITPAPNGFYRFEVSAVSDATASAKGQAVLLSGASNTYTGDGVSGVYLWGAQLEFGPVATGYIAT